LTIPARGVNHDGISWRNSVRTTVGGQGKLMSNLNLRTLATFATPEEANLFKSVLETRNILSVLEGEQTVGLLWHLGNAIGGIKLQVAETDWDAASAVLAETHHARGPAWKCPKCGADVDATFDLCWKCGVDRQGQGSNGPWDGVPAARPGAGDNSTIGPAGDGDLPDEDDEPDESDTVLNSAEEVVARAWRAAILGILLPLGIISVYSLLLLATVMKEELSPKATRRFTVSLAIDGVMLLICCRLWMDLLAFFDSL
jgi:hypothetical protein